MKLADLSIRATRLAAVLVALASLPLAGVAGVTVDHRMTGAWFDPTHSGEGYILEVLDETKAVVYWFTYDEEGQQRWFIGEGEVLGDCIEFAELLAGSGGRFGPGFDPEDVVLSPVGDLSMQWSGCDAASATYQVDGNPGSQTLVRLTDVAGLECGIDEQAPYPQTGSWYDRTHTGEGLVLEALPENRALVFWFSYDGEGRPAWFYGTGVQDENIIHVDEMLQPRGGRFGPDFNPGDVEQNPWGSAWIDLDCNYGKLDYESPLVTFGDGGQTLFRLTNPGNAPCEQPEPPNILLVIADDLGKDASAQYVEGDDPPATPVLDGLAAEGLIFENAWSNPTCSPTRAGILTGKYGIRTGILKPADILSTQETSLQQYIETRLPSRYSKAVIGKWHLGPGRNGLDHPGDLGISHFAGILGGGVDDYENWVLTSNGEQSNETTYSTSRLTDLATDWISAQQKPWFLWLAFNAPHTPFHLPPADLHDRVLPDSESDITANPRPYYLAAIESMDHEFGRLLASLDEQTRENTLIIFLGDNGTPVKVAISPYSRQKAKGSLYQGGINVPFFVSGAGVARAGEREYSMVNTTDLFATIAGLTGVNVRNVNDSVSFASLLSATQQPEREYLFSERDLDDLEDRSVSDGRYKLIEFAGGRQELYDLQNDPYENDELLGSGNAPEGQAEFLLELLSLITAEE